MDTLVYQHWIELVNSAIRGYKIFVNYFLKRNVAMNFWQLYFISVTAYLSKECLQGKF